MCTPSTHSTLDGPAPSLFGTLSRLWQDLASAGRQTPETLDYLSPHLRRDVGLDDGRLDGRRTAADFTGRHGLAP